MTKQNTAERVLLGVVLKAHGIRGEVVVRSLAEVPENIAAYGPLDGEDCSRQFDLTVVRPAKNGLIVRIDGIDDRNQAEALKGAKLFVPRGRLPQPEDGTYYHVDLIGLKAVDTNGNIIGTVSDVQNYGAGDILEITHAGSATTEQVPFIEEFVPSVSIKDGTVMIVLPTAVEAGSPEDQES